MPAKEKYNNMVQQGKWSKVDPKDAKIVVLATKVSELEKRVSFGKSTGKLNGQSNNQLNNGGGKKHVDGMPGLEMWWTKKKGNTKTVDRKVWK